MSLPSDMYEGLIHYQVAGAYDLLYTVHTLEAVHMNMRQSGPLSGT